MQPFRKQASICLRGWWVVPKGTKSVPGAYELNRIQLSDRYNWTVEALLTSSGTICVYEHNDRSYLVMDLDSTTEPAIATSLGQARSLTAPYILKVKRGHWIYTEFQDYSALLEYVISLRHDRNVVGLPKPLTVESVKENDLVRPEVIRAVVNNPEEFLDEMIVYEQDHDVGLRYKSVGDAAPITAVMGEKWRSSIIGAPFDEGFIDSTFEKATGKAYLDTSKSDAPAISRVTGFMQTPAGSVYQRYIRIVVRLQGFPERVASFVKLEPTTPRPFASVGVQ